MEGFQRKGDGFLPKFPFHLGVVSFPGSRRRRRKGTHRRRRSARSENTKGRRTRDSKGSERSLCISEVEAVTLWYFGCCLPLCEDDNFLGGLTCDVTRLPTVMSEENGEVAPLAVAPVAVVRAFPEERVGTHCGDPGTDSEWNIHSRITRNCGILHKMFMRMFRCRDQNFLADVLLSCLNFRNFNAIKFEVFPLSVLAKHMDIS
ncbi:hypothetical protein MLD38_019056 [Melastoma candidum]|uniref:Uncharacterized protein n=1 Tax=Melastoma candidum TaxID=119954 RepID=A0ACB9QUZ0_9MYRT|nr:hypothetical protein MLD38_019056 [Melastoma candidum]